MAIFNRNRLDKIKWLEQRPNLMLDDLKNV